MTTHVVNMEGTFSVTGYEVVGEDMTPAQAQAEAKDQLEDYALSACSGNVKITFSKASSSPKTETFQVEVGDLFIEGKSEEEVREQVESMLDKIKGLESWGGIDVFPS